jgi:hypothetical protein
MSQLGLTGVPSPRLCANIGKLILILGGCALTQKRNERRGIAQDNKAERNIADCQGEDLSSKLLIGLSMVGSLVGSDLPAIQDP